MQGKDATPRPRHGFTNGTDTFFIRKLKDGGTFVLDRYAPSQPTITANPHPDIVVPASPLRPAAGGTLVGCDQATCSAQRVNVSRNSPPVPRLVMRVS